MDKSPQYINMCKTSKEIQSLWEPKAGDFYSDTKGSVLCISPDFMKSGTIRRGFGIIQGEKVTTIAPVVWLPRLDQLMEAAQTGRCCFRDTSFQFYEWVKLPYGAERTPADKHFSSLEQVWLAFIMQTRFAKTWIQDFWKNTTLFPVHS